MTKGNQEKKEYVAPLISVIALQRTENLLQASKLPDVIEVEIVNEP
jgi:hypothetical protein